MTRKQVAELAGINYNAHIEYEQGKVGMSSDAGMEFLRPEESYEYRDWFMFDEADSAGGQIAPTLTYIGQDLTTLYHSDQRAGW